MITMKDAKVFLKYSNHSRSTCSDDNPQNWYTTDGRDGYPRCVRCMMIKASNNKEFAEIIEILRITAVQSSEE